MGKVPNISLDAAGCVTYRTCFTAKVEFDLISSDKGSVLFLSFRQSTFLDVLVCFQSVLVSYSTFRRNFNRVMANTEAVT